MMGRAAAAVSVLPPCVARLDEVWCGLRGDHFCVPRAMRATSFFEELLVHTKGPWARSHFLLAGWQRADIVEPVFGRVVWDFERRCYRRQKTDVYIELARKNGKGLAVDTPVLARSGWTTMGVLLPGDEVHAPDGSLARVQWVSDRHLIDCYRVLFADGAELVVDAEHKWTVNDRRLAMSRIVTTSELAETTTCGAGGVPRYTVEVPDALDRPVVPLPVDPYLLGLWLGNGTTQDRSVGWGAPCGAHVPDRYLIGSSAQRRALLQGLMDGVACVNVRSNPPRVEFTSRDERLARAVLLLARSLGWKASAREGRTRGEGRARGRLWRVAWTAYVDDAPFRLSRKIELLGPAPEGRRRAETNAIVSVDRVPSVETVCIAVEHPSHQFLAGESLTPTHNSELAAGMALLLLVGDGEESAEVYGCARDVAQAWKMFDVAARMVRWSPSLSRRLQVREAYRRIVDERTASYYEVVPAGKVGDVGRRRPHGVIMDDAIAQPDGRLWEAMSASAGSRVEPLFVRLTNAGRDSSSWAAKEHEEAARAAADPRRAPHRFVYLRNTPEDADPWDEGNWGLANPALDAFLSREVLRREAFEARNDPVKERAFRQFRLCQWVSEVTGVLPLHAWGRPRKLRRGHAFP